MLILALDTSSTSGSIALAKDNTIIFSHFTNISVTHSERLMPSIQAGMEECGLKQEDLGAIALAAGPGSFTGIRIGMAAAKGLAYGLKIPLLPFNTLLMTAANAYGSALPILVVHEGSMGEVFSALYSPELDELSAPTTAKLEEILAPISKPVLLIGTAAHRACILLQSRVPGCCTALAHQHTPSATALVSLVNRQTCLPAYNFDEIAKLEPLYLRKSQAEYAAQQGEK